MKINFNSWGIEISKDIADILDESGLIQDTRMNKLYQKFIKMVECEKLPDLVNPYHGPNVYYRGKVYDYAEAFLKYLECKGAKLTGVYNEGEYWADYTGNQSNILSENFSYIIVTMFGNSYVYINNTYNYNTWYQGNHESFINSLDSFYLSCIECKSEWSIRDNRVNRLTLEDGSMNLLDLEVVDLEDYQDTPEYKDMLEKMFTVPDNQLSYIPGYHPKVINPVRHKVEGKIIAIDNESAYCPICGIGKLKISE